jgi:hypothetical protein
MITGIEMVGGRRGGAYKEKKRERRNGGEMKGDGDESRKRGAGR